MQTLLRFSALEYLLLPSNGQFTSCDFILWYADQPKNRLTPWWHWKQIWWSVISYLIFIIDRSSWQISKFHYLVHLSGISSMCNYPHPLYRRWCAMAMYTLNVMLMVIHCTVYVTIPPRSPSIKTSAVIEGSSPICGEVLAESTGRCAETVRYSGGDDKWCFRFDSSIFGPSTVASGTISGVILTDRGEVGRKKQLLSSTSWNGMYPIKGKQLASEKDCEEGQLKKNNPA